MNKYSNEDVCLHEIFEMKYPDGVHCKTCNKITKHYKLTGRKAYSCEFCRNQIHPLANTIFEKSTTPLRLWFYAMFLMINTRAGVSAKTLQRELGVTYKTAWRMFHQIRKLMAEDSLVPLDGEVEIDETYVGGKGKNRRLNRKQGSEGKEAVMGFVQRGGKVYLKHVEGTGKWEIIEQVNKHVSPKARVITDQYPSYTQLKKNGFTHDVIDHGKYYGIGDVHTNNIENVWSHLKRGITGVYRHVSKKHLQAYADEFAWRYNNRKEQGGMFKKLLEQAPQVKMISV